jgi:DNA repair protein RecN (Recombination protein N)
MLQRIYIQNFAIIQQLQLEFGGNLQVITGETGAGKSILLGALGILLGDRFDSTKVFNAHEKCIIEAHFNTMKLHKVSQFLALEDFEDTGLLIIRREMSSSGKSRSFINDTPASVQQLLQIAALLVDLHRQFDTLSISETAFQTEVLDAYANNTVLLDEYTTLFTAYEKANTEHKRLVQEQGQHKKEQDFNLFLLNELEEAAFISGEIEEADAQLKLMNASEDIAKNLENITHNLYESETPITATIKQLANQLQQHVNNIDSIKTLQERLLAAYNELQDISDEASTIKDRIQFDEAKYIHYQERVNLGFKLLKKHNVADTNALLTIQEDLATTLQKIQFGDEKLNRLEKEKESLESIGGCSKNIG